MLNDKKNIEIEMQTLADKAKWKELANFSKQAIENFPDEPKFYSVLAEANYNMGKYKKAIKNFSRSINLNNQYSEAYNGRSQVLFSMADYEAAKRDYQIAVELDPDNQYIQRTGELLEKASNTSTINRINIQNYFSLQNIFIDNLADKKEIFFLGNNGAGKTILLQAILLALRGNSGNETIFRILKENDDLLDEGKSLNLNATDSEGKGYNFELNYKNQTTTHHNIFAYGINRLRFSAREKDLSGYLTLFDSNQYLSSPIEWLKEVERKEKLHGGKLKLSRAIDMLQELLYNKINICHDIEGEIIFKEDGKQITFEQLSDGYKSIISWASDLLSKLAENQPNISEIQNYKGIVLIDELGAFLHPNLEHRMVQKLRFWFPKIQFIFTTHSPLLLLGSSADAVFYKLYKEKGVSKISKPLKKISNLTANSIITSPLFDLDDAVPASYEKEKEELETGDSFLSVKIHQAISKKIVEMTNVTEDKISDLISEELRNPELE